MADGETLPEDEPYAFCVGYCEFFSICRSQDDSEEAAETITDPELADAIAAYGEATKAESGGQEGQGRVSPRRFAACAARRTAGGCP